VVDYSPAAVGMLLALKKEFSVKLIFLPVENMSLTLNSQVLRA